MAKPWARLEQNYINHPKFLALTADAICLWHEAKNYCDMHQTDGLIPRNALKTFRFTSRKSVEILTKSCGKKLDGEPFAPLWEVHDVGFKMHDYLDHNDCREEVLQRLQDAKDIKELRRVKNRDQMREARAKRRSALTEVLPVCSPRVQHTSTPTETETETIKEKKVQTRASDPLFAEFWARYPKKKAKEDAQRAWLKRSPTSELLSVMLSALERQKASPDWLKDSGRYIPLPASWLNGARWTDELEVDQPLTANPFDWICTHEPRCAHRAACAIVALRVSG